MGIDYTHEHSAEQVFFAGGQNVPAGPVEQAIEHVSADQGAAAARLQEQLTDMDRDKAEADHVHSGTDHAPHTLTVNTGTLEAGTVADLATVDTGTVEISEAIGADPLRATLDFSGVGTFSAVLVHGYYQGSAAHNVSVEIYLPGSAAWEMLGLLAHRTTAAWYSFPILYPSSYLDAGAAQLRFRHVENGVATHDLFLDYVVLRDAAGAAGAGITDHGALTGLEHRDHPASAVSFSPAGDLSSTDVQAALEELDDEKSPVGHTHAAGSGDVVGPASAVDGNFAGFDGTTGKLIKDSGSKAADFATSGHSHSAPAGVVPVGGIIMWSGTVATIPTNWALCDGSGSTPDLRDRFVVGARQDDAGAAKTNLTGSLTQSGGAVSHHHADHSVTQPSDHAAQSHSGAAVADHASHTHTYTQVPNHVHGVSTILRTATTGSATTQVTNSQDTSSTADTTRKTDNPDGGVASGTTAGPSATLTHSVTQPSDHAAQSHSGTAVDAHDTLSAPQPYFALAFIMRTA